MKAGAAAAARILPLNTLNGLRPTQNTLNLPAEGGQPDFQCLQCAAEGGFCVFSGKNPAPPPLPFYNSTRPTSAAPASANSASLREFHGPHHSPLTFSINSRFAASPRAHREGSETGASRLWQSPTSGENKVFSAEHRAFDATARIAAHRLLDAGVARANAADHVAIHRNPAP